MGRHCWAPLPGACLPPTKSCVHKEHVWPWEPHGVGLLTIQDRGGMGGRDGGKLAWSTLGPNSPGLEHAQKAAAWESQSPLPPQETASCISSIRAERDTAVGATHQLTTHPQPPAHGRSQGRSLLAGQLMGTQVGNEDPGVLSPVETPGDSHIGPV